jgi:hypothetical protein
VLPKLPGRSVPLASDEHANATLDEHEQSCYTGELGLFHTGTGPTSAPGGNPGPNCDSAVSAVPSERSMFTLNSAIAAVSEGNYGRLGENEQRHYIRGNLRSQLARNLGRCPAPCQRSHRVATSGPISTGCSPSVPWLSDVCVT